MKYTPEPFDDRKVSLPKELELLVEDLSRNVHEVWAADRIRDGWKYGPVRNDGKKEHPCLIPYEKLSEEEKNYDRATAVATIKFILAEGYSIKR